MRDCKKYQGMIKAFDLGRLSCENEEDFINHLETCDDCKEEFEIYYIIEYGLNDDDEILNTQLKPKYKKYLDKYDFKGLIQSKINDSYIRIENAKRHNKLVRVSFIASNIFVVFTLVSYIIIKYF